MKVILNKAQDGIIGNQKADNRSEADIEIERRQNIKAKRDAEIREAFSRGKGKEKSVKYVLVGETVKVYSVNNGVVGPCIKTIPLSEAPMGVLMQIENVDPRMMMVLIQQLMMEENMEDTDVNSVAKEYEKHGGEVLTKSVESFFGNN